ncbi:MAG: WecB/TagA/CpsF family glycosyltransferase [Hyphomicrobiales bacterium]
MSVHKELATLATVEGCAINLATLADARDRLADAAEAGEGFTLFTLNLDHLVKLRTDRSFREAYGRATFVSADGAPVVRLARRQGASLKRTTGADLILPLCEEAAFRRIPVFLFGSTPESLAGTAEELRRRYPGIIIAGMESPAQGFDPESPEADAVIDRIADSGARLCFVALGAPKQEIFSDRAAARRGGVGYLCIGAALDFISGHQVRAPRLMQATGFEWLWRLLTNPRRMADRYARCALLYAEVALSSTPRQPANR